MFEIYLIINKINGKKYVGYTFTNYKKRFSKHVTESLGKSQRYLCRAIRKYGKENFDVTLLATAPNHLEAKEMEIALITEHNSFAHSKGGWGYNATIGGEGINGYTYPEEARKKVSDLKKSQKAWCGTNNPNFGKGAEMSGEKHFLFGKNHSKDTRDKISIANRGKCAGEKNYASVNLTTFAKSVNTGEILKAKSFYEMGKTFRNLGYKFNRSTVLRSIRSGQHSVYGFVFYRKDVTDKKTFNQIEFEYNNNIIVPPELPDYGKGKHHPNVKNETSFALHRKTGDLYKFDSWYECKTFIAEKFDEKITYSDMYKVAIGKRKSARGFIFFRSDLDPDGVLELEKGIYQKPSTTSRKA